MNKKVHGIILLFMILIIVFLSFNIVKNYVVATNLERKITKQNKIITDLKDKNKNLEKEIKKIDDPEFIKKIAKEKLGLVKPGENLEIPKQK